MKTKRSFSLNITVIVILTLLLLIAGSLAQETAKEETAVEGTTNQETAKEEPTEEKTADEETNAATKNKNNILNSNQLTLIVAISIFACLLCIYGVLFWGRQIQEQSALRDILVDGMKQQEYAKLYGILYKRAVEGPLDPDNNNLPPGYDKYRLYGVHPNINGEKVSSTGSGSYETIASGELPYYLRDAGEEAITKWREEQEKIRKELKEREDEFTKWENKETVIFEKKRKEIEEEALKQADKKVPKSMDISLLGGGFSFLLEFSTVIVIIFTLLILGLIGSLGGNEISTILASIAGYVLGKATSTQSKEKESPT